MNRVLKLSFSCTLIAFLGCGGQEGLVELDQVENVIEPIEVESATAQRAALSLDFEA